MKKSERLSKVLAKAGIASRRKAEDLIFDGKVMVNGQVVLKPETHVDASIDKIVIDGVELSTVPSKVYYILNKPKGFICSNVRPNNKKIVTDLFKGVPYRLFTVGRLDRDTTGLLIVTNDGHFANQVIHPSANLTKEYLVRVNKEVSHDHLVTISEGAEVEGVYIRPVRVTKVRKGTIKVVVKEGKKREVRVLVENAGLEVQELKRIRIGGLVLGTLPEGKWREMTEKEKQAIFK